MTLWAILWIRPYLQGQSVLILHHLETQPPQGYRAAYVNGCLQVLEATAYRADEQCLTVPCAPGSVPI